MSLPSASQRSKRQPLSEAGLPNTPQIGSSTEHRIAMMTFKKTLKIRRTDCMPEHSSLEGHPVSLAVLTLPLARDLKVSHPLENVEETSWRHNRLRVQSETGNQRSRRPRHKACMSGPFPRGGHRSLSTTLPQADTEDPDRSLFLSRHTPIENLPAPLSARKESHNLSRFSCRHRRRDHWVVICMHSIHKGPSTVGGQTAIVHEKGCPDRRRCSRVPSHTGEISEHPQNRHRVLLRQGAPCPAWLRRYSTTP